MKNRHTHLIVAILFIGALVIAVFLVRTQALNPKIGIPVVSDYATDNENLPVTATVTTPKGVQIYARVANTDATRQLGLSYFPSLPDSQGMLFTFTTAANYPFWMKGMAFPLDIIWMKKTTGNTYQVVGIVPNLAPSTFPNTFGPGVGVVADAVLEINTGEAAKFGIVVGKPVTVIIAQ